VFHFRKTIDLADRPTRFVVRVSADNRYRLFVNGVSVSIGPARGDLLHWRYETVDLAPYLRAGRNVLAAVVWNWGETQSSACVTAGKRLDPPGALAPAGNKHSYFISHFGRFSGYTAPEGASR